MTTETEKVDYSQQFKILQKRIVLSRERGEDPAPILQEQAELRAKIAAAAEIEAADRIVGERKALRDKAEAIKTKCQIQADAIDAFLKLRDSIVAELTPIIKKAMDLPQLQENCYSQFRTVIGFPKLPAEYLPPDTKAPMLVSVTGTVEIGEASYLGINSLRIGLGWLSNMKREDYSLQQRQATEFEVIQLAAGAPEILTSEPETDTETNYINCCVCQHPQAGAINEALRTGVLSLRDIEAKYPGVSRSSLSRHEQRHLKLKHISQEIILQEPTTNER